MESRAASGIKLAALLFGVLAVWALWGLFGIRAFAWLMRDHTGSFGAFGQLGDLFGAVNALFAALAFLGVAIAAYYQQKTWHLQVQVQRQQAFEPLFFQLLDRVKPPASLAVPLNEQAQETRPYGRAVESLRHLVPRQGLPDGGAITLFYERFYSINEVQLGPYFRSLYHVIKQVHTSGLPSKDCVKYCNIVRAALSVDDLYLLALDALTDAGRNLRALTEQYGVLKHRKCSPGQWAADDALVVALYSPTATMSHAERLEYWRRHPEERKRLDQELDLI